MKTTFLSASIALLLVAAQASAELMLTPRLVTIEYGGVPVQRAYFMDGQKKFAVTIDSETELVSHGEGALFRFSRIPLATVELRRSPMKAGKGFSPENIADYTKLARQFLPANAEVWTEEPIFLDPLPINRWKTCRFNFFYRVGGSPIRADVTFIELNAKDQIVVITGATASTYAKVRYRSDDIIRRWHEVTAEEESGAN